MSLFDERALRDIVADELRRVLREERSAGARPANDVEYLPVAEAAARAAVAPATIRVWMAQGRLGRYHAGRELRVSRSSRTSCGSRPRVPAGEVTTTSRRKRRLNSTCAVVEAAKPANALVDFQSTIGLQSTCQR
jgi:hypothetical protein